MASSSAAIAIEARPLSLLAAALNSSVCPAIYVSEIATVGWIVGMTWLTFPTSEEPDLFFVPFLFLHLEHLLLLHAGRISHQRRSNDDIINCILEQSKLKVVPVLIAAPRTIFSTFSYTLSNVCRFPARK